MIIAVDFDGTIVTHEYPLIGASVPLAIETMRELVARGHQLILYTMRSGPTLEDAAQYLVNRGVQLWGINHNPEQYKWTSSSKVYAHLYIDDAALGCPLIVPESGRPYVNWVGVRTQLVARGIL